MSIDPKTGVHREAGSGSSSERRETARVLGRIVVFVVLIAVAYAAFRQFTVLLFAPEIEPIRAVVPTRAVAAGSEVRVGALVWNPKLTDGAAFVVAALPNGDRIEGPTVDVPAGDTTFVPVDLALEREDQGLSLVVFDGWRGVRRLWTYSGLRLEVTEQDMSVDGVELPEDLVTGAAFTVRVDVSNFTTAREAIRVRILVHSGPYSEPREVAGELGPIDPGATHRMEVRVEEGIDEPGLHFVEVVVEDEDGSRLGGTRFPLSLPVR